MLFFGCASTTGNDGGGPSDAVVDTAADAVADTTPMTGCADGGTCGAGLMCCVGVPYPAEGLCAAMCDMRSDRDAKERFTAVDASRVLESLARLPITEWSYRDEPGVRHVGPMAQDFRATFGLGRDARSIHPVDANGVTMAAVQALHRRLVDLERQNVELRESNRALRDSVTTLASRVSLPSHARSAPRR